MHHGKKSNTTKKSKAEQHAGRSIIINAANHDWSTGSIADRINKRKKGKEKGGMI